MRMLCALGLGLAILGAGPGLSAAPLISETFNDISTLAGDGWVEVNNSTAGGVSGWFQGNTSIFDAQSGPGDSYVAANFENAGFGGNISNWLITPVFVLNNGVVVTFYTRTESPQVFADALEVRMSTNGASADAGATDASVGDFTTLLLAINPGLDAAGYPDAWTQYTVVLSGLAGATNGRIAFRYAVQDTSINGDYIGLDTVDIAAVPEPSTAGLIVVGAGAVLLCRTTRKGR